MTATAYVLADKGFARTTTNRIAEVAGVNVGTLYRYFPNKDALVGALIDREAKATLASVDEVLASGEDQPVEAVVRALLSAMVDERRLDARVHRELVEQVGRSGRVSVLRKLEQDIAERLLGFIRARTGRKSIDDAPVAAFLVLHAVEAMVHAILFLRPANISRKDALESAIAMVSRFLEA
ncbi:MAG TPA: TetR/AcrR family transcriptional regulator [Polyangia bacterium]|nr:TetR/AcrR family transcriptional regulator [Polyangia bacterium]